VIGRLLLTFAGAIAALAVGLGCALVLIGNTHGRSPLPRAARRPPTAVVTPVGSVADGGVLFAQSCASCHGAEGVGVAGRGPALTDAGRAVTRFDLETGRMPMAGPPGSEPVARAPVFSAAQIASIARYVGTLCHAACGPSVAGITPSVPGDVATGRAVFAENCAGCHQIVARGGLVTSAADAPSLVTATPDQIAAAVRTGPYVMPSFGPGQISDVQLASLIRYIQTVVRRPDDRGGWGIGNLGPVPEGLVTWFIAILVLLGIARLIGSRT
jgi:ubiquinol-cytochrome c reductase cytochrome c subunit